MTSLAPYAAFVTAVLAGYIAFRHQQRLKAFELFYGRRASVLEDIEAELAKVHTLQEELETESDLRGAEYQLQFFHHGLVLHHKVKGANFGKLANMMGSTYFALLTERLSKEGAIDLSDWLGRVANTLAALHGIAHSALSYEMEMLTLPWHRRLGAWLRRRLEVRRSKIGNRDRLQDKAGQSVPNHAPAPGGSAAGEGS